MSHHFSEKKALLLDMNGTFMFGEDRFAPSEDYSLYYSQRDGTLDHFEINRLVRSIYDYLNERYLDENYRHHFPSLEQALQAISDRTLDTEETEKIVATFAHHEMGYIPDLYVQVLHRLKERFRLGAVIDIWSPKNSWLEFFERKGISSLFEAISFSSDHGIVKPSPKPFQLVLKQLKIANTEALVVGDCPRRDLGGARNAGIECILVGGAKHSDAVTSFNNLLEFANYFSDEEKMNRKAFCSNQL